MQSQRERQFLFVNGSIILLGVCSSLTVADSCRNRPGWSGLGGASLSLPPPLGCGERDAGQTQPHRLAGLLPSPAHEACLGAACPAHLPT